MAKRPKTLSDDDKALWKKVAESTTRLRPAKPDLPVEQHTEVSSPRQKRPKPIKVEHAKFRLGERAATRPNPHDLAPSMSDRIAANPVAMDRKTFGKMKKGRISPEARIDLHGMTIAQAYPVLTRFILSSVEADCRLVLVITGKGKHKDEGGPIPVRHGVLRHQVPHWLHTAPLRQHVLQISEAHLKHGGQGAYYVYLRRRR
ncbi:Smr/MutS family protein [Aliiroseovarius sp. F20344]|uniref:Smr/MutS family protein n=1 Tax=Aliiroseovarius sp. F20344 TaxID=2926414 RepID=UPI001FF56BAF|nr:Smr/MutS family protein [Aliiroseovarius sp. F20344]MCK0141342.1 Smr/MutS family protein [Aliiroseovarius sp. F20344]